MFLTPSRTKDRDRLIVEVVRIFERPDALVEKTLQRLAEALDAFPEVEGAAVIAYGRDLRPLAIGSSLLRIELDEEQLAELPPPLRVGQGRCPVRLRTSGNEASAELQAVAANTGETLVAAILLAWREGVRSSSTTDFVAEVAPWIAATVAAAMRAEAAARTERLQKLARRELGAVEPNLDTIVRELGELFQAVVCTILLEEEATGTLRLSASTDVLLGTIDQVVYAKGEGLTGWVFANGTSLRMARTDEQTVREVTGRDRKGPRFLEHDHKGRANTQYLGVPIRAGEKTFGVLRMSRPADAPRFSAEDETALQFFADLLGIALKRTWKLVVGRTIEESSSIAIAITRREPQPDGSFVPRLIYVNPGATEMFGYVAASVVGKDARELYAPGMYEALYHQLREKLDEAVKHGRGELGPIDSALMHKDGNPRSVKISYRILADRRIRPPEIYTIGIFREQTIAVRAQAQHRRLMEMLNSMGIAYFRADLDGKVMEVSETETAILGYSQEELLKLNRAVFYDDPRDRVKIIKRAVSAGPGELLPVRQPLRRKDGTQVHVAGYIRTVCEELEQGQTTVEGLYRDVTKRLEIQSFVDAPADRVVSDEALFEKLREHEQRQHDYLSSLGHQLITPLASLVGNLDDLRSGLLKDKAEIDASLRWVIGQAKQCMRMVRNLSYLDKILRREPLVRADVSMAKICVETKLDFLHLLEDKRMRLEVDDRSLDTHLEVRGHADLLRQAIVNLVDNAIKYSRRRSTIDIRGTTWPRGRVLEISNEGLPIPPDARENIFERGFRTDRARALVPHGTGLGLWLVRRILEAHDATIACDEVEERGRKRTRFRLTFPHPEPPRGRRAS